MINEEASVIVNMSHVRQCKMCSRGARVFFERHGLDWQEFIKNGLPSEVIEQTGDAMALQVVKVAKNGR